MSETRVEQLLRAERATAFAPGFAWRVMHRLRAETADPRAALAAGLQRYFLRLAPVAALAAAALVVVNVRAAGAGESAVDAALGLPGVTVEQAYAPYVDAAATPQTEGQG